MAFSSRYTLARHVRAIHDESTVHICGSCGQEFNRMDSLKRHLQKKRKCGQDFTYDTEKRKKLSDNLPSTSNVSASTTLTRSSEIKSKISVGTTSKKLHSQEPQCSTAPDSISTSVSAFTPARSETVNATENVEGQPLDDDDDEVIPIVSVKLKKKAFNGKARVYEAKFLDTLRDPLLALDHICPHNQRLCNDMLNEYKGLKLSICLIVQFFKALEPNVTSVSYFWCHQKIILRKETIHDDIRSCHPKIMKSIDEYMKEGSGWVIAKVLSADLTFVFYEPLSGRCFTTLPEVLRNKKAILNIQNNDDKCFLWCVIAKLYPTNSNRTRVQNYQKHEAKIICDNISFPVCLKDISKFETLNNVSINVYGYEDVLFPLHISNKACDPNRHIDLLLYDDHYFLVTQLDRLLSSIRPGHRKKYFCHRCLFPYYSKERLQEHIPLCLSDNPTRLLPPEEPYLSFKNIHKMLRQPIVVYADFECFTSPIEEESVSNTEIYQRHVPASYGFIKVDNCCGHPKFDEVQIYRGETPVTDFLNKLIDIVYMHSENISNPTDMTYDEAKDNVFRNAKQCNICEKDLDEDRVKDHCHLCGTFRGAVHNKCNQLLRLNRDIVVVFHNLRRYDGHLIMQQIGSVAKQLHLRLDCVAKSMEDYLGFTLTSTSSNCFEPKNEMECDSDYEEEIENRCKTARWRIRFIDSCQFLPSALSNLTETMDDNDFIALRKEFTNIEILKRKGVFPYDLMADQTFFERRTFPNKNEFYNKLNKTHISDEDYEHAIKVWKTLQNLGDYHDLYLKLDVILLADIVEKFRCLCLQNYRLDPVHYLTLPSFAFDACFRMTKVELQTIKDPDVYSFFENGIRGGISVISHRFAEANNPSCSKYDAKKPNSYIIYLDMNNLYGTAMSNALPRSCIRWLTEKELQNIDFLAVSSENPVGYVIEVDLEYPKHLHDEHNDYLSDSQSTRMTCHHTVVN